MTGVSIFLVFVTSLSLTFMAVPIVLRVAHSLGLYDRPDSLQFAGGDDLSRRIHTSPVPRLGGIAIVLGFFTSILLWVSPTALIPLYLSSLAMFLVGVIDDIKSLSAKLRLIIQILLAGFVVYKMDLPINQISVIEGYSFALPKFLGYCLSVFTIVGSINAINLTDGLDGLASGIVMIGSVLLSMIYFLTTKDINLIVYLSLPLIGSLLGFLKYNTHPASIFMGDGGSNWLGLIVGFFLVILLTGTSFNDLVDASSLKTNTYSVPFLSIILCVALPALDTAFVMIRRIIAGKSPMVADKSHFHHTLLYIGLSHSQTVITIYFVSILMGVLGVMPIAYPKYNLSWLSLLAFIFWVMILTVSLRLDQNALESLKKFWKNLTVNAKYRPFLHNLIRTFEFINRYVIYCIFSIVPLVAGIPHSSLGYIAIIGLMVLILGGFSKGNGNFFQSFTISVASSILLTTINFNSLNLILLGKQYNIQIFYNLAFVFLFFSTMIYIALTMKRQSFLIVPTDFLVVTLPFCLLFVPEPYQTDFKLNVISLRSLVLFVAIRALARSHPSVNRRASMMCGIGLFYVFLVSICGLRFVY